jgi:hypothetical protein
VVIWAIGYYAFDISSVIHILLVIAVIAVLLRVIKGKEKVS